MTTNEEFSSDMQATQSKGLQRLSQILSQPELSDFKTLVKQAIQSLSLDELPLQQALTQSSVALQGDLSVIILGRDVTEHRIELRAGIGFYGILSGCSCADDPTPVDRVNEYADFVFTLKKESGKVTVRIV